MSDHETRKSAHPGAPIRPGQPLNPDRETRCALLAFSRRLLTWRLGGSAAAAPELPGGLPLLDQTPGLFVTLRLEGDLRGCIGSIRTDRPLRETLPRVTLEAALEDHRFRPLTEEELPRCSIEHSLLTVPAPVPGPTEVTIGVDGIILEVAGRRALYLPEVATDQGWDLVQTLASLSRKAGLTADAWRDPTARFEVFQTIHYGEGECL